MPVSAIKDNLARVRDRIHAACARSGRKPGDVTLIAVTKYVGVDEVRAILDLGVRDLGESRAVEGAVRTAKFAKDICWHFIGRLQTNKVWKVVNSFQELHSLDRIPLAEEVEKKCATLGKRLPVFVQVNVSGEATKAGFRPEETSTTLEKLRRDSSHLAVSGLMTMAPQGTPDSARPVFRRLRELAKECGISSLSMGMSNDFEVAIEEGATHIRVGTALFA